jgi:hypothetical protein
VDLEILRADFETLRADMQKGFAEQTKWAAGLATATVTVLGALNALTRDRPGPGPGQVMQPIIVQVPAFQDRTAGTSTAPTTAPALPTKVR